MKYILVTGGVVSGLGKGVTASSIGLLLIACGLRVTSIKIGIPLFHSSFSAASSSQHRYVYLFLLPLRLLLTPFFLFRFFFFLNYKIKNLKRPPFVASDRVETIRC